MRTDAGVQQPRSRRPYRRTVWCDAGDFRETRLVLRLNQQQTADLLRVAVRTVRNWEAGRNRVPYAAYKLLRIMKGLELPGWRWRGWRVTPEHLTSPEGRTFAPSDMAWWSLTCAMARAFREERQRAHACAQADQGTMTASAQAAPPGLVLSKTSDAVVSSTWQFWGSWRHTGATMTPELTNQGDFSALRGSTSTRKGPSTNRGQNRGGWGQEVQP